MFNRPTIWVVLSSKHEKLFASIVSVINKRLKNYKFLFRMTELRRESKQKKKRVSARPSKDCFWFQLKTLR